MTNINETYKCNVCGNIVEVVHTGVGKLVCCDQPMELQIPKTEDEGQEKHVPIIEKIDSGYKVKIGEIAHPMEEEHFIEWIELIDNKNMQRKYLKPGNTPEAKFETKSEKISVRSYCNIHGLWKN